MLGGIGSLQSMMQSFANPRVNAPAAHSKAYENSPVHQGEHPGQGKGLDKAVSDLPPTQTVPQTTEEGGEDSEVGFGEKFQQMIEDTLLNSVGLGGVNEPGSNVSGQYFKAQFEINFQSMSAVADAGGIRMEQMNFSMKGSFEFLSMGQGGPSPFGQVGGAQGAEGANPLSEMQDYFSPEKTAGRILDFALSFFPDSSMFKEGGNTESSRQSFSDFIGAAIQKGFDEAGLELGDVSEETQQGIDQTHDTVFTGLDDFVQNGVDESKSKQGGMYDQMRSYSMQVSMNYESVSLMSGGYNDQGNAVQGPPPHANGFGPGGMSIVA